MPWFKKSSQRKIVKAGVVAAAIFGVTAGIASFLKHVDRSKQPIARIQETEKERLIVKPPRPLILPITSAASSISAQERIKITNFFLSQYQMVNRQLLDSDPNFKKLVTIEAENSISWYGRRAGDLRLRKVVSELAFAVEQLAKAYNAKFRGPLLVGYGWDFKGHVSKSAHYAGLAVDIDVGPDIGSKAYNVWAKKRFQWIAKFLDESFPRVQIIFGEKVGKNVMVLENHKSHMHLDLRER